MRYLTIACFLVACSDTPTKNTTKPGDDKTNDGMTTPTGVVTLPTGEQEPPEPTEASVSVSSAGGTVTLGKLSLAFPPGAVSGTVDLSLFVTSESVEGYQLYSKMYHFEPEDLELHDEIIALIPFDADGANAHFFLSTPTGYTEIPGQVVGGPRYLTQLPRMGHGFVGFKLPEQIDLHLPEAPSGLIAHAGDTEIDLTWPEVADATSYRVRWSAAPGGPYESLGTYTHPPANHPGLTNAVPYYYVVAAANASGLSPNSEEVNAVPEAIETPDTPLVSAGNGRITIAWTAPPHASSHSSYVVWRTEEGASGPTSLPPTVFTQYPDTTVTNGVEYTYQVQAIGPAPSGSASVLSEGVQTFPFALAPTGSMRQATGPNCVGATGVTNVSGVTDFPNVYSAASGCAPCAYAVGWGEADAQATFYKVRLQFTGGDTKDDTVHLVQHPKDAFMCAFAYDPDIASESNALHVSVATCYGDDGSRCTDLDFQKSEMIFQVLDDAGIDGCTAASGYQLSCPFP